VDRALTHPGGREGWEADADREATALLRMRDVPGVVDFRCFVRDANGGLHLIFECAPLLCRCVPLGCAISVFLTDGVCLNHVPDLDTVAHCWCCKAEVALPCVPRQFRVKIVRKTCWGGLLRGDVSDLHLAACFGPEGLAICEVVGSLLRVPGVCVCVFVCVCVCVRERDREGEWERN
jgi:hypothetical protein